MADVDTAACDAVNVEDFNKEISRQGLKTSMELAEKCTSAKSYKAWKNWNCQKYLVNFHCEYFRNAWKAVNNRERRSEAGLQAAFATRRHQIGQLSRKLLSLFPNAVEPTFMRARRHGTLACSRLDGAARTLHRPPLPRLEETASIHGDDGASPAVRVFRFPQPLGQGLTNASGVV